MYFLERTTRETSIHLTVARGSGKSEISTGIPFLDHMMVTFARYASLDGATGTSSNRSPVKAGFSKRNSSTDATSLRFCA